MSFDLNFRKGLYCCNMDVFSIGMSPTIQCHRTVAPAVPDV
jgi:hypothetical protein